MVWDGTIADARNGHFPLLDNANNEVWFYGMWCMFKKQRLKLTQLEKEPFIKMNELKLTQVELF